MGWLLPIAVSYLAGALVSMSPCVLPILPLVVGAAAARHRWGPAAMGAGLVTAFVVLGMFVASLGPVLGLSPQTVRGAGAWLLILAGLALAVPWVGRFGAGLLAHTAGRATAWSDQLRSRSSLGAQFGVGALLGAVWAPCAGPVLGGAIGLAASEGLSIQAAMQMAAFGLGTVTPLLVVAYGARAVIDRNRGRLIRLATTARPAFGLILLAAGLLVLTGLDGQVQVVLERVMPAWFRNAVTSL